LTGSIRDAARLVGKCGALASAAVEVLLLRHWSELLLESTRDVIEPWA